MNNRSTIEDRLYEDLLDTYVARHSVAFFHERAEGAVAAGSGTLVRCGPVEGVLTCAHILSDILRHAEREPSAKIGITICSASTARLQAVGMCLFQFAGLQKIIIRGDPDSELGRQNGPDLGFVRLPPNIMSSLASIGSVLDLAAQALLEGRPFDPSAVEWMYLASGTPAEEVNAPVLIFGRPGVAAVTGMSRSTPASKSAD